MISEDPPALWSQSCRMEMLKDFHKFRNLHNQKVPADLDNLDLLPWPDFLICCLEFVDVFGFAIWSLYTTGKIDFYWVLSKIKIFCSIMIALKYHNVDHKNKKRTKFLIQRAVSRHHTPTETPSNRPARFHIFIPKMVFGWIFIFGMKMWNSAGWFEGVSVGVWCWEMVRSIRNFFLFIFLWLILWYSNAIRMLSKILFLIAFNKKQCYR